MKRLLRLFLTRIGFRQQLVLTFTIGIVCLTLLSSLALSALSSRTVRAKLVEQGRQVTETFAAQSTLALLYHSAENATESARAMLAFPDVRGVAIYDLEHRILLAAGEEELLLDDGGQWPDKLRLERETAQAWHFVAPVYARPGGDEEESPFVARPPEPELIGFVRVVMGKGTLKAMVDDILHGNLIISIALASVLLLSLLAITNRVTRPLKNLAEIMRQAPLGQERLRAEVRGPKDIIVMESAFNTMMEVLEAREQELKTARDVALALARAKSEFAANVSHELRTPLNGILGMLELLHDMGLTSKQSEYVEVARNSGDALLTLINDILDFSQIDSRKLNLQPVEFRLQEILDDVVGLLGGQAQRKDLDLGYAITEPLPAVLRGDPARIRQVLINLVGNAIKFTERGEVAIEVRALEAAGDNVLLCFEVQDTGIGIPVNAQQRIFEPFFQADSSTTRKYGGTGLGLAICRQLVEFMSGEINVESKPGKGSRFWFKVPLEQTAQFSDRSEASHTSVAGLRVLIVDDSAVNRRFLEQTLSAWGMYHQSAADGWQALEILRTAAVQGRPFELAIIDELMPGLKGTDLVRQLAKDPAIAQVKVVMMTNRQLREGDEPTLTPIAGCVAKPVRHSRLYDCIATIIKQPKENAAPKLLPAGKGIAGIHLGSHILVVEDNRANQQVAIGMLQRLGCRVEVAVSGREALEAVIRGPYDLVLMDCQMPHMDGYEATRQIRALEAGHSPIPIIAMTANVQEGDSERCLAAGMDDYLSKPLRLKVLQEKLQRWLAPRRLKAATSMACIDNDAGTEMPARDQSLDPEVFSELREHMGDAFSRMIEVFLEDMPVYLAALEQAVLEADAPKLRELAHSVKGSSRNFGANRLSAVCKQLEELSHSGSINGAAELLAVLAIEYELVKTALQHEIQPDKERRASGDEGQPRVLIVDDDRGMRLALRKVLEEDGYRIEEAGNGMQALALCARHMPDLILMDAVMPEVDGFSACKRLRQQPGGGHIPLLIITALDDERSIERAFAAGATDYIPKPVHFAVLRQRVARLLRAGRAERHVRQLAYHDVLTGLPNRALFMERLGELLERARPEEHKLAVLFLDLDRFKLVNDTLGHDVGDLLLKAVAERIHRVVRAGDLVARLGGDEFTIILDRIRSPEVAAGVAEKICNVLSEPFVFMEQEMYVTTSIGISMYPVDGQDIGTLIKHADTAMFRAKEQRGHYRFYEDGMGVAIAKRLELESALRRALERNEFVIHYQPQADLMTGRIVGMEALVRWQHPERGLVPPAEFIPLAEETGLIVALGEWVLHNACLQLQSWLQQGFAPLVVAVNLSGRQLESQDLVEKVAMVLNKTGLPPHLLELEITESIIMQRAEDIIPMLHRLKEMGIKLAIDDFGTGYSSLSYLKRFPIDMLKIDRSFLQGIPTDPDDGAIITAIVALAKSLRLKVTAEGVELKEQKVFLQEQGCHMMQGYYLSKPLSAAVFEQQFLQQNKTYRLLAPEGYSTAQAI